MPRFREPFSDAGEFASAAGCKSRHSEMSSFEHDDACEWGTWGDETCAAAHCKSMRLERYGPVVHDGVWDAAFGVSFGEEYLPLDHESPFECWTFAVQWQGLFPGRNP
jgi:hypothetical protein